MLFTGIFGLSRANSLVFLIVSILTFVLFDILYSFRDVSYWGMVPALSEDSYTRSLYTSAGNFTNFGSNLVTIIVVPVVTYVTFKVTGQHEE